MPLRKFVVFLFFTFATASIALGQVAQSDSLKKLRLCEIAIYAFDDENFVRENDAPLALTTFKTLAPQSVLLNTDFSEYSYTSNNGLTSQLQGHGMYSVSVGFHLRDKTHLAYRPKCRLRFSLGIYANCALLSGTFEKPGLEIIYDTVASGPTYRFSINTQKVVMQYNSKQLIPEASFIYQFNPQGRWDVQVGFGMAASLGFDAETNIHYDSDYFLNAYDASGELLYTFYPYYLTDSGLYPDLASTIADEKFKGKNNYGLSAFAPVIVDFKWGKNSGFWQHIHSVMEVDLGVGSSFIPGLDAYFYRITRIGFGLKYFLN